MDYYLPLSWFYRLVCCLLGSSLVVASVLAQRGEEAETRWQVIEDSRFEIASPLLSADGYSLYYTYNNHPRNQGSRQNADIWLRHRQEDGSWARALNAGSPINSVANDYAVGLSADGKRLAVFRQGYSNFLDILQQGDRSWRILHSVPLEAGITDVSFDLETQKLVYSKRLGDQQDLFERHLLAAGEWSAEQALSFLNSDLDEKAPYLSFDGNSLYFRRAGSWFVSRFQASEQTYGEAKQLEQTALDDWEKISISVVEQQRVVGVHPAGKLLSLALAATDQPLACQLFTGQLQLPPAPEDKLEGASLRLFVDGRARQLYPDLSGSYTIVVPADRHAQLVAEAPGFFAPSQLLNAPPNQQGALASSTAANTVFSPDYYQREDQVKQLQQHILASQATLAELNEQRKALKAKIRQAQLAAGREILDGFSDPELESLRARLLQAQANLTTDTLPPSPQPKSKKLRPKTPTQNKPIDFEELEAMKAIFRTQQEDKLRKKGEEGFQWEDQSPASLRREVEKVVQNSLIPELSEDMSRSARFHRDTNRQDSLALLLEISSTLFPSKTPAVYERQPWENELLNDLRPATENKLRQRLAIPIEESLEAERQIISTYQQEQYRLAAYQDSLQAIYTQQWAEESQTLGQQRDFSTKGLPPIPIGTDTAESQLNLIPLESGRTIVLPLIQFLPNNNRFAPIAYQELNRLVSLLQEQTDLAIDITAHTNDQLGYLAAQELSEERAFAVLQYLTEKGIALQRLSYSGSGRQAPLVPNESAENRAKNQRVEITIR